jgi:hypothetical protein
MPEITHRQVRDWMNANKRGYGAAAAHFGIDENELRELCRGPLDATHARARAHAHDVVAPAPTSRRSRRRADPEPVQPAQPPAVISPALPPDPLADTLAFYEQKLKDCEMTLGVCPPQAAAPLFRRVMQLREKIDELRAQLAAKDASKLSQGDIMDRARDHASRLPDAVLEVFVLEYMQRNKLELKPL